MAEEFQPGETVRLKSGGPVMTVKWQGGHLTDTDIKVCCTWFEQPKNIKREDVFEPATLERASPPSSGVTFGKIVRG